MSFMSVSSSVAYIEATATLLNTSAQRFSLEILAGFEFTIFRLVGEALPLDH